MEALVLCHGNDVTGGRRQCARRALVFAWHRERAREVLLGRVWFHDSAWKCFAVRKMHASIHTLVVDLGLSHLGREVAFGDPKTQTFVHALVRGHMVGLALAFACWRRAVR
jgi:hypothetical protein